MAKSIQSWSASTTKLIENNVKLAESRQYISDSELMNGSGQACPVNPNAKKTGKLKQQQDPATSSSVDFFNQHETPNDHSDPFTEVAIAFEESGNAIREQFTKLLQDSNTIGESTAKFFTDGFEGRLLRGEGDKPNDSKTKLHSSQSHDQCYITDDGFDRAQDCYKNAMHSRVTRNEISRVTREVKRHLTFRSSSDRR